MQTELAQTFPLSRWFLLLVGLGAWLAGGAGEAGESRLFLNLNIDRSAADNWRPEEYERQALADLVDLGMAGTRETLFGMGKFYAGRKADWSGWDARLARIEAAGLAVVIELMPMEMVANEDNFGPGWENNLQAWVHEVVSRYGTRALWYSLDNEPDFRPEGTFWNDPDNLVRMQRLAWEALKKANPEAKLETSPIGVPEGMRVSARDLCERGITQYCDYFGIHAHFASDDPGKAHPVYGVWEAMRAGVARGYPARPVVNSETGAYWGRFRGVGDRGLTEEQQHQWRAWYYAQNLVMQKSYGISYLIAYAWANSRPREGQYNLVDMHNGFHRWQPEYDTMKALWNPEAHALGKGINGGFEEPNPDYSRGWAVAFALLQNERSETPSFPPAEWARVQFSQDGIEARTGRGCLRLEAGGRNRVRRLVEGLEPGKMYELFGYARLAEGAGKARLAAMGYNPLDGLEQAAAEAEAGKAGWQELRVEFAARNPWVVIALETGGEGTVWWDDLGLRVRGSAEK